LVSKTREKQTDEHGKGAIKGLKPQQSRLLGGKGLVENVKNMKRGEKNVRAMKKG